MSTEVDFRYYLGLNVYRALQIQDFKFCLIISFALVFAKQHIGDIIAVWLVNVCSQMHICSSWSAVLLSDFLINLIVCLTQRWSRTPTRLPSVGWVHHAVILSRAALYSNLNRRRQAQLPSVLEDFRACDLMWMFLSIGRSSKRNKPSSRTTSSLRWIQVFSTTCIKKYVLVTSVKNVAKDKGFNSRLSSTIAQWLGT